MLLSSPRIDGAFVAMFLCARGGACSSSSSSRGGLMRRNACPPPLPACRSLVREYFPKCGAFLASLGAPGAALVSSWFRGLFAGWLPRVS